LEQNVTEKINISAHDRDSNRLTSRSVIVAGY